jgi:hypothetical protein
MRTHPARSLGTALAALVAILWLAAFLAPGPAASEPAKALTKPLPTETSCVKCHSDLDGDLQAPTKHMGEDVHFTIGLSCHDCHGGDPTAGFEGDPDAAHSKAHGFRGKPARTAIPAFCARCHADAEFMKKFDPHMRVDQYSEYLTSTHGKQLQKGDDKVAVCVDCHGVHGIRKVSDPMSSVYPTRLAETCARCHTDKALMTQYGLPTEPYADYKTSVHAKALYEGGDISAPTCNDCHGSHGAAPPGVGNVSQVCGSCHGRESTLFRETEAKRHIDLSDCIQCIVCHSNHAVLLPNDDMLGVGPNSTCITCHSEGDSQYALADSMHKNIQGARTRLAEANDLLTRAARAGVEVTPDLFALKEGQDKVVEARVLVHSFDAERFLKAAGEAQAVGDHGLEAGRRAFAELRYRRTGLVIFLVIVVAVIAGLSLKARELANADRA